MPQLVRRTRARVLELAEDAARESAPDRRDHLLHDVRKAAKRARYAGEAVAPAPSSTPSTTPSASPTPSSTGSVATESGKTLEQLRADAERIFVPVEQLAGALAEARLVRQEDRRQPVDRFGLARHLAIGIEISVEVAAGLDAVEDLDAADLDHAVAAGRIETGGFGIEYDFPHA